MSSADWFFKDAIEARDELTKRQEKAIRKSYNEWAKEVREEANRLSHIPGSQNEQRQMAELYYQLRNASRQLSAEINNEVNSNVNNMGSVVVRTNQRWLSSLGLSTNALDYKMSASKDSAIRSILSGNLYQNGKPLSERVWNLADGNLKDIYSIIGRGIALNQSPYDIAKQLEKYLNPNQHLGWTVKQYTDANGRIHIARIGNNQVDWKAQRLARTMLQHSYQQTLVSLTKDNPFVLGYIWHADGANACELCMDRDGQFYKAEELPLDHPNGQCDFEVAIDEDKARNDLAGFFENPIEYPDIQRFVSD